MNSTAAVNNPAAFHVQPYAMKTKPTEQELMTRWIDGSMDEAEKLAIEAGLDAGTRARWDAEKSGCPETRRGIALGVSGEP